METSSPERGWEAAHTPLPSGMGDETLLLPHDLHQVHGLLQSEDVGRKCFWSGDAKRFLTQGPFVEGWFELWDIYDKWVSQGGRDGALKGHKDKLPCGHSKVAKAAGDAVAKWWRVIHPDGKVEVLHGLTPFCREHGLHQGKMTLVARGERSHHHGFKVQQLTSL